MTDKILESHRTSEMSGRFEPSSFKDCFYMDGCKLNPTPKGVLNKIKGLLISPRYSMPVLMRLSQYFHLKQINSNKGWRFYRFASNVMRRINGMINQFDHGTNPRVEEGVVFFASNICLTSEAVIESGAQIFRNVTLCRKAGRSPHIKRNARICSHAIVIGGVTVGEEALVGAGAVLLDDVPARKIAAGNPAKIIGDVTPNHELYLGK